MSPPRLLQLLARLAALVPVFLATLAAGGALFAPAALAGAPAEAGPFSPLTTALVAAATHVLVVAFVILRSRLAGWRLVLAASATYYGCATLMAQIETGFFLLGRTVSGDALLRLFLMGLPPALLFVPLAVRLLAPLRRLPACPRATPPLPAAQWAWKLSLLSAAYLAIYLAAGYYLAWRNPELRVFYGGSAAEPEGFRAALRDVAGTQPWIIPLQLARGLGWALLALPAVRLSRPGALANALAAASLLALPMNAGLLFPNPFMPPLSVRLSHLVETATSTFAFGLLAASLLHRPHASWRDLFREASAGSGARGSARPGAA